MKADPPFRAEHIGSLLRPPELLAARRAFDEKTLSPDELRRVEDRWIREAVALQERVGLRTVTDGEYRRVIYFGHFPAAVSGFTEMEAELAFTDTAGRLMTYVTPVVTGTLRRLRGIATDELAFVRGLTRGTVKVTLPSPCSQHFFRWRAGVSERAYPDVEEFVAERIFTGLDLDVLFLEYDSPRAGSFDPLRFVPEDRRVVLGLVSTKTPALEPRSELRRRIDEAARFVPLEGLALSPQCGFASTAPGNPLTPADQEAKLRLVVDTAREVWRGDGP